MSESTYIYLIRDHDSGLTKIGRSDRPIRRLEQLVKQPTLLPSPHNFELIFQIKQRPEIETDLHGFFAFHRSRGEWFWMNEWDCKWAMMYAINPVEGMLERGHEEGYYLLKEDYNG